MENRVFVCCAVPDKVSAAETCNRLESAGLNIKIDGLSNGDTKVEDLIESARFVLVFFSHRSAAENEALDKHLELALRSAQKMSKDRVFIIPVRLEKCDVPESVDHLQLIDLFKDEGFDQIVDVIRGELSLFTDDRDGQVYRTIEIGGLTWLSENLNFEVTDSWWYDNDPANGRPFGRLYTWEAAQAACPSGWHIPSVEEWQSLVTSVGGSWDFVKSATAYEALKEGGITGFEAVLGGVHEKKPFDGFYEMGQCGMYWGVDAQGEAHTFFFSGKLGRLLSAKQDDLEKGYACRCVRNS